MKISEKFMRCAKSADFVNIAIIHLNLSKFFYFIYLLEWVGSQELQTA